jgi:molybdate transport system substrate-binding protein
MKVKWTFLGIGRGLASALVLATSLAQAAEIKVIAANAVKESVLEVISLFEKASGHKVVTVWGGTDAIAKRVGSGEVFDVVIIAGPNIDKLEQEGKVVQGSRIDFARSGVGVAVRTGLPRSDISSAEAVKRAVLGANSVAYSSGPSGFYITELFKRLGIADQIKDKVKQPASGVQVGELIARGEADLGFQQISELMHVKGIDYLGPLPAEIQSITVYSAGLHSAAPAQDAAKAFMKILTAPESAPIIKKTGMDPA